jgi:hypothetical protein
MSSHLFSQQSRAVAYCRQPASTVTLGIKPRWDPSPYIYSVSRLFFSFVVPKGGVGLFYNWYSLTTPILSAHLESFLYSPGADPTENIPSQQYFHCCSLTLPGNMFTQSFNSNGCTGYAPFPAISLLLRACIL